MKSQLLERPCFLLFVSVALVTTSCVSSELADDDDSSDDNRADEPQSRWSCEDSSCGHNSPFYNDRHNFGQLAIDGQTNSAGIRLSTLETPGGSLDLDIVGGELIGRDVLGEIVLAGSALIGSRIVLERSDGATFQIRISGFDRLGAQLTTDTRSIPRYVLEAGALGADETLEPICDSEGEPENIPAFVLMGEKYTIDGSAVEVPAPSPWFNFVCQNRALAKMKHLAFNPEFAVGDPYFTSPNQRVATLRMLTADYFSDGVSFTEPGTPLFWQARTGWVTIGAPPVGGASHIEAGWDENGARCLGTPRVATTAEIEAHAEETGQAVPPPCPAGATAAELFNAGSTWVTWSILP